MRHEVNRSLEPRSRRSGEVDEAGSQVGGKPDLERLVESRLIGRPSGENAGE